MSDPLRPVVAVVVHWRAPDETLGCVASLAGEGVEVIVVDNGGPDPIAPRLAREAPTAVCVRSPRNLGYAGGANLGIRAALAQGAGTVLLLNDDARVQPGATGAALATLAADDRVAVVGARVVLREDPSRLWLAWGRVTWGRSLVALDGANAPDGPAWRSVRDVDWVGGCAMWFRAAALERLGLLDEDFFAYHEEVDWCARARESGWRVVYAPEAVVSHDGRGSAAGNRVRRYLCARNTVLFARRHGSRADHLRLVLALALGLPLELVANTLRGRPGDTWVKLRGLRDALAGRPLPLRALGLE